MAIYQSFDALPDELKQRVIAAGAQRYGKQITPEQLSGNGGLAQQLMAAAGIDMGRPQDDVGIRDNLDWIDRGMEPAPPVDAPRKQVSSAMRSGKGDRLDAQDQASSTGSTRSDRVSPAMEETLPPRRPTYITGTAEGEVAPATPNAGGSQRGGAPTDIASSNAPSLADSVKNSPAAKTWDWLSGIFSGEKATATASTTDSDADDKSKSAPKDGDVDDASSQSYRDIAANAWNSVPPSENMRAIGRKMVESEVPPQVAQKLQAAGIDPTQLSLGQKTRMQTMGIDRWIAEQTDQRQRDSNRRMSRAQDKSGR